MASAWTTIDFSDATRDRRVAGRTVRYLDYGDGPPLVLLHGFGACWQWWLEVIPRLSAHHRVIAVDLPGFGASEALPRPAEMQTHAEVVLALLDQLGVERFDVAGHSMGGLVALAAEAHRPARVRGLILVDAGGVPMSGWQLRLVQRVVGVAHRLFTLPGVQRLLARPQARHLVFRGAVRDPRSISSELASVIIPLMDAPGVGDALGAAGRAVTATDPAAVRAPVLLAWGDRDPFVPVKLAHAMRDGLADAELVVFERVGHSPMLEVPDQLVDAMLAFTSGLVERAPVAAA